MVRIPFLRSVNSLGTGHAHTATSDHLSEINQKTAARLRGYINHKKHMLCSHITQYGSIILYH